MDNVKDEAFIEDSEAFQKGIKYFDNMSAEAADISKNLVSMLTEKVIKESESDAFNLTTVILAVSKALAGLASYLYDSEEEFLKDLQLARVVTTDDIIPTLLNETPCGECEQCKNGHPEACINKQVRENLTTSRFLPILCSMIIEYDFFNKIVYSHLEAEASKKANDTKDETSEIVYKEEGNE